MGKNYVERRSRQSSVSSSSHWELQTKGKQVFMSVDDIIKHILLFERLKQPKLLPSTLHGALVLLTKYTRPLLIPNLIPRAFPL